ncbi:MAG: ATP-binding protein [Desulfobacterales bacterium]|nr:ATP-binding protein [Desulfobacterales bacterium]
MADEIQNVMARNLDLTGHLADRVREETLNVVQLQKQVDHLKQLTALGHLTANLAHDLGTPLHSIAGLAKLMLEREGWPPDVAHKLNLIVEQTQRLDNVIQNVRKATRLPEPHFELMTVHKIFSETLPLVEPLIQKNHVTIDVQLDRSAASLYVDRYRIQTALLNIIQNSIDAMPDGGKITISAEDDRAAKTSKILIADNGQGIEADLLKKSANRSSVPMRVKECAAWGWPLCVISSRRMAARWKFKARPAAELPSSFTCGWPMIFLIKAKSCYFSSCRP